MSLCIVCVLFLSAGSDLDIFWFSLNYCLRCLECDNRLLPPYGVTCYHNFVPASRNSYSTMPFLVPYSRNKPVPDNSHNGPALGYKGHGIIVIAEKKAIGWV